MPAVNFLKQFAPAVRASIDAEFQKQTKLRPKGTTFRNWKRPIKKGDTLYLYTGMRTKYCHKIGEAICSKVEEAKIYLSEKDNEFTLELDGIKQSDKQLDQIAKLDGFPGTYEMVRYFSKNGYIGITCQRIHWTSSYKRKYYLHYKVKRSGFEILLDKTSRTILVPECQSAEASENKYINELKNQHSYGVQLTHSPS